MKTLLLIFSLCLSSFSFSQTNACACCNPTNNQFDFWVGSWNVYDTTGTLLGTNTITKGYDNCVLREEWTSAKQNRGTSLNYVLKDGNWEQLWVDNQGTVLKLKGGIKGSSMIMASKKVKRNNESESYYYNQITWTPQSDGSVIQLWEQINMNGEVINTLFKGIYKKSEG